MNTSERRARLAELFEEHAVAVRGYALRRSDPQTADDVVSEVFVVACRRLQDIPEDPRPWLLGCARKVLANQRRGERRRVALAERLAAEPELSGPEPTGDEALATAFASLRPMDREVLALVAWDGMEGARAARVLGCSRGALAVRLHRARRRLERALRAAEPVHHPSLLGEER
jgi:RNA polymerase sigma-70 factor (ECF subfamily)